MSFIEYVIFVRSVGNIFTFQNWIFTFTKVTHFDVLQMFPWVYIDILVPFLVIFHSILVFLHIYHAHILMGKFWHLSLFHIFRILSFGDMMAHCFIYSSNFGVKNGQLLMTFQFLLFPKIRKVIIFHLVKTTVSMTLSWLFWSRFSIFAFRRKFGLHFLWFWHLALWKFPKLTFLSISQNYPLISPHDGLFWPLNF